MICYLNAMLASLRPSSSFLPFRRPVMNFSTLTRLVLIMMLVSETVHGSVLCREGQECRHVSLDQLKVILPKPHHHHNHKHKRSFGVYSTESRRSMTHPCRWKLCGAFNGYQQFANAMRRLRR